MRSVKEAPGAEVAVVVLAGVRRTWEGPSRLVEVEKHRARGWRRSTRRLMAIMGCRSYHAVPTIVTRHRYFKPKVVSFLRDVGTKLRTWPSSDVRSGNGIETDEEL